MTQQLSQFTAVVPAAGVGKRMGSACPKQYLHLAGKTLLEHTLDVLISHPRINHIVLALGEQDEYFSDLPIHNAPWLTRVKGGAERADSVLAGLQAACDAEWVLVHDAARPCLSHEDLDALINQTQTSGQGAILATPVRDTMKRANALSPEQIAHTESREHLWHALTPQMFPRETLLAAIQTALAEDIDVTDEASAMEWAGHTVHLVEGGATNIKVTRPADLALAEFYLTNRNSSCE